MKVLVKVFNCFKLWTIFAKHSILDVWFVPIHTLITTTIFSCFYLYLIFRSQSTNFICNTKKEVFTKENSLKSASKSGNFADVMLKAGKAFDRYKFLSWLDDFIQSRQGRINLPQIQLPRSIDSLNQFPIMKATKEENKHQNLKMEIRTLESPKKSTATKSLWTTENVNWMNHKEVHYFKIWNFLFVLT